MIAAFNTERFLDARGATLTVTFDKPSYAEVQLTVTGHIRSDVVASRAACRSAPSVREAPLRHRPESSITGIETIGECWTSAATPSTSRPS